MYLSWNPMYCIGISSGAIQNPLKDRHRKDYIAAHLNNTKYAIE